MKKNIVRIAFFIICILLIISNLVSVYGFAITSFSDFDNEDTTGSNPVKKAFQVVISLVRIVAVAISIIMLLVLGMKYMIAAPGERADIKKGLIIYTVGACVVYGSTELIEIILELSENFN